jgi:hypothetical protein
VLLDTPTDTPTDSLIETPTETVSEILVDTPTETVTEAPTETPTETATSTAFAPEPPLSLVFGDNFDAGVTPELALGTGWSLVPTSGGQALQLLVSEVPAVFVHDPLGNVAVQMRVLLPEGAVQLNIRQSGSGDYHALLRADGQAGLFQSGVLLQVASTAQVAPDVWRTLRLSAMDGVLRVTVDGVEVIAIQDSAPLPPGGLSWTGYGLGATGCWLTTCRFSSQPVNCPHRLKRRPKAWN